MRYSLALNFVKLKSAAGNLPALILIFLSSICAAQAGPLTEFVLDPTQSYFSVGGQIPTSFLTGQSSDTSFTPVVEQFPGSASNTLSGDVFADLSVPGMIQWAAGSNINLAASLDTALPAGAPAQIAIQVSVPGSVTYGALRNTAWTLKGSDTLIGDVIGKQATFFNTSVGVYNFDQVTQGFPDTVITALASSGNKATTAFLDQLPDGRERLTLTYSIVTVFPISLQFQDTAQIVAYSAPVPEPGSVTLAFVAMLGFVSRYIWMERYRE